MNPLGGRLNESVWQRSCQRWGRYVGPDPDDPADTCIVTWSAGGELERADIRDLLTADHPSAGQVDRPAPDTIEVRAGQAGTDSGQTLWFVPGRRPENRRAEAFHITRKLVEAGLFDWAVADYGADEPARTERSRW